MMDTASQQRVRDAEREFLRKAGWLFPLAGLLAPLALGGPFWRWVEGQNPLPLDWSRLATWPALAGVVVLGLVPLAWRLTLRIRLRPGVSLLLGLIAALAADGMLRLPQAQAPLWLASRARLGADQFFMREVCYVRLEEAAGRTAASPALILVGSSQMLHGVDDQLLRDLVAPVPVIRRAMFGLTPLKALAMMDFVPFRTGDVCIQYLSEFDFTNQEEFPFSWFRPYATLPTFTLVMQCIDPQVKARHWEGVIDYLLATRLESWRSRDFLRQILFHFWRADRPDGTASGMGGEEIRALVERAQGELVPAPAEWKAFEIYSRVLAAIGVRQWVFEGEVNPEIRTPVRLEIRADVRERVWQRLFGTETRYIDRQAQDLELGEGFWRDMTHLNEAGRKQLTRRIAEEWNRP